MGYYDDVVCLSTASIGKNKYIWCVWNGLWDDDRLDYVEPVSHGYLPTKEEAVEVARDKAYELGEQIRRDVKELPCRCATTYHRALVARRKKAKTSDADGAKSQEYVYLVGQSWGDYGPQYMTVSRYPIQKRTKKRIYVLRREERLDDDGVMKSRGPDYATNDAYGETIVETFFLDRAKLEAGEQVSHRKFLWDGDFQLEKPVIPYDQRSDVAWERFHASEGRVSSCPCPVQEHLSYLQIETWPTTPDDVDAAYRRLARKYHPDCGGTEADFVKLQTAYETVLQYV